MADMDRDKIRNALQSGHAMYSFDFAYDLFIELGMEEDSVRFLEWNVRP